VSIVGKEKFDEEINFPLNKGAYQIGIKYNQMPYRINFYALESLKSFSLKQTLGMKSDSLS